MCPRKCGPASFHCRRVGSLASVQSPLRVATSSVTGVAAGCARVFAFAVFAILGLVFVLVVVFVLVFVVTIVWASSRRISGNEKLPPTRKPDKGVEIRAQGCDS